MASQNRDTDDAERIRELEDEVETAWANFDSYREHIMYLEGNRINAGASYEDMDDGEWHPRSGGYDYEDDWDEEDDEPEFEAMDDDDEDIPEEYREAFRPDIDQDGMDYYETLRFREKHWKVTVPNNQDDEDLESNPMEDDNAEDVPEEHDNEDAPQIEAAPEADQNAHDSGPAVDEDLQAEIEMWKQLADTERAALLRAKAEIAQLREENAQLEQLQRQQPHQPDAMDAIMDTDTSAGPSNVRKANLYGSSNRGNISGTFARGSRSAATLTSRALPNSANQRGRGGPRRGGNHRGRGMHHTGPRRRRRNPSPPTRPFELPMLGNHRVFRYPPERYIRNRNRCAVEASGGQCLSKDCKDWHYEPLPRDQVQQRGRRG